VLEERGRRLERMCAGLMAEEPRLDVKVEIRKQYRNMYDVLSRHPEITARLEEAVRAAGIAPGSNPIAGGRTARGSPRSACPPPTSSPGGVNFHGPSEWISTRVLAQSTCTILNLVQLFVEEG
jgi:tripeptide aminopeptidase